MNRSVMGQLILKDLYFSRWLTLGSVLSGVVSVALMPMSTVAAYVGGVFLICVLVILNIMLVMNHVVQERTDKVLLFVLSLPVSVTQYITAKLTANFIAFAVPWLVLTSAAAVMIHTSHIPDGLLPFWLAVLTYLLFYYCVLLAVGLVSASKGWHAVAITAGNISVNLLIPILHSLPSVAAHRDGARAVWTSDILAILALEVLGGALALVLAIRFHSRRSDFV